MISLGGTRVNARRSRARRKGVHAGLIPGSTDAKAQGEFYDGIARIDSLPWCHTFARFESRFKSILALSLKYDHGNVDA